VPRGEKRGIRFPAVADGFIAVKELRKADLARPQDHRAYPSALWAVRDDQGRAHGWTLRDLDDAA
jgi:hypothetical protein